VRDNNDLAFALLGDLDNVAEVTGATLNLDLVVQELLERSDVEDLVGGRLRGINHELPSVSFFSFATAARMHAYLVSDLRLLSALGSLLYCIFSVLCLLIIQSRKRISSQPTSKAFGERTMGAIAEIEMFARDLATDGCKVVVNLHEPVVDSRRGCRLLGISRLSR
jgi:hypothetical protein